MVTSNTQPGTFRVPQSVAIFTFHTKKHGCWLSVHIAPRQVEDCVGLYGCQPPHQHLTSPPAPAAETPGRPQRSVECRPSSSSSLIVSDCAVRVLCIVAAGHSCSPHLASSPATSCCRVLRGGIMPRHQIQIQQSTPHHSHSHRPSVAQHSTFIVLHFLHHKFIIYYKHFL